MILDVQQIDMLSDMKNKKEIMNKEFKEHKLSTGCCIQIHSKILRFGQDCVNNIIKILGNVEYYLYFWRYQMQELLTKYFDVLLISFDCFGCNFLFLITLFSVGLRREVESLRRIVQHPPNPPCNTPIFVKPGRQFTTVVSVTTTH